MKDTKIGRPPGPSRARMVAKNITMEPKHWEYAQMRGYSASDGMRVIIEEAMEREKGK